MKLRPRERVLRAIKHQEPDRVPVDFGGSSVSGITGIAYNKLKSHLRVTDGATRIYDLLQQLAIPERKIVELLGSDIVELRRLRPQWGIRIDRWKPWILPDGSACEVPEGFDPVETPEAYEIRQNGRTIARMPKGGYWFDQVSFPLENDRYAICQNGAGSSLEADFLLPRVHYRGGFY